MKTILSAAACLGVLALVPTAAPGDNPAPHLRDKTETLFDAAAEAEVVRLLEPPKGQRGYLYNRDMEVTGTPIVGIVLMPNQTADNLVSAMRRLNRLQIITAYQLTPEQLSLLTQVRQLQEISIVGSNLGASEMKALARLPHLRCLKLYGCTFVGEDALKEIANSPRLQSLLIYGGLGVTDEAVLTLVRLKSLNELSLNQTAVTDAAMSELAKWPNLRSLDIGQTLVTNAGLVHLANSTSLIELKLHYSKVDDEGIKKLSRLKGLQCLNLRSTAVTDSALAELARLPNLVSLNLSKTAVTKAGLEKLARSTSLTELNLRASKVDDDGLEALGRLRTLRELELTLDPTLSDEGVRRFKATLPNCKVGLHRVE
jgi:hypothetical protein